VNVEKDQTFIEVPLGGLEVGRAIRDHLENYNQEGKKMARKQEVQIVKPLRKTMIVEVEGLTSLIHNRFSSRAKLQMAAKHAQEAKKGKGKREPEQEFEDSLIVFARDKKGKPKKYGVRAIWFKLAMNHVAKEDKLGATVFRNIQVGKTFEPGELLPITPANGSDPHMRAGEDGTPGDTVRNANGSADIRYRGEFSPGWRVKIPITFNASRISEEQVLAWLDEAGTASGIGDWRPQKGGQCGMFKIVQNGGKRGKK